MPSGGVTQSVPSHRVPSPQLSSRSSQAAPVVDDPVESAPELPVDPEPDEDSACDDVVVGLEPEDSSDGPVVRGLVAPPLPDDVASVVGPPDPTAGSFGEKQPEAAARPRHAVMAFRVDGMGSLLDPTEEVLRSPSAGAAAGTVPQSSRSAQGPLHGADVRRTDRGEPVDTPAQVDHGQVSVTVCGCPSNELCTCTVPVSSSVAKSWAVSVTVCVCAPPAL
jgi:hypothetical protein